MNAATDKRKGKNKMNLIENDTAKMELGGPPKYLKGELSFDELYDRKWKDILNNLQKHGISAMEAFAVLNASGAIFSSPFSVFGQISQTSGA